MRPRTDFRDTARSARRSRGGSCRVASLLWMLVAAACGGEVPGPSAADERIGQAVEASTETQPEAAEAVAPATPAAPAVEAFAAHEPRAVVDERAIADSLGFRAESLAFDWGEVAHGEVVLRRFTLRNGTQNRVRLAQPRRLAAGVTIDFDREIEPFSEGRVDVRVDTSALHVGDAMVKVPLVGNVPNAPVLVLRGSILPRSGAAEQRE